ncbi:MAG: phosphodiester glycosidase family protein [Firmicutes bacterium]|nr:phosphodiester glycosidase family protein [Bacillota bacterium]
MPTLVPPSQTMTAPVSAAAAQRELKLGDTGDDVMLLKTRMQNLGYFIAGAELSPEVTDVTMERLNQLLAYAGMDPVETISVEIQQMIFSRDDLAENYTPAATPKPGTLIMPAGRPELPQLDAEGFLADPDGEYVFEDTDDGLWYYITDTLYVNIRRYKDTDARNIWYETEIKTRGDEQMRSFLTKTRNTYQTPVAVARANSAVLAFTDDYFTMRGYGIAIRDQEVYVDKIRTSSSSYPLGDTLAVFGDGRMQVYDFSAFRADDYLEMGALHVLTFGPWLLRGGEINQKVLSDSYMHYREPRCALGMIEPGHFVVITADGRYDGARGVYFSWLALRLHEIGVVEGINLDGGGTTALVFMGHQISRVAAAKSDGTSTRQVTSMLGFGISDAVPD